MKNEEIRKAAIEAYKAIKSGKVEGVKIYQSKKIKVGSVTFII